MRIYDYEVKDAEGNNVAMNEYEGKVLLIVNTATGCGFTPQYEGLQDLYEKYQAQGLEILDFPCNQFGNQAPGTMEEIVSFCDSRYGITFPMFSKINVNGDDVIPLYKYLKEQKGFEGFDEEHELTPVVVDIVSKIDPDYKTSSDIKWNFTKFLISRDGEVLERFEPTADMIYVEDKVLQAL